MQKEIWKDIPNYEGYYQVSNLGRIKSLERYIKHAYGGLSLKKERILKPGVNSRGYLSFNLLKNGSSKNVTVHSIVAIAFLNHKPDGHKLVVDHIDNDKLNNRLDNLQIITNRENCNKDRNRGLSKYIGVSLHKKTGLWRSRIRIGGKDTSLGYFKSEYEAHLAYQKALKEIQVGNNKRNKEKNRFSN